MTICTHDKQCLFGGVVNSEMRLNEIGAIVRTEWLRTATVRPNVILDEFVIMPNHVHGIILMNDCRGVLQYAPTGSRLQSPTQTVGAIVRGFKSATTRQTNEIRGLPGRPVWQRNYFDRIIRDEDELNRIREYILQNPAKWAEDKENPEKWKAVQ